MASTYTVKSGDTLSKIAAANQTTVAKLIEANPFLKTNPKYNGGSTIFSGTTLTLPTSATGGATSSSGVAGAVSGATGGTSTGTSTGTSASTSVSTGATGKTDTLDMATLQAKFGIAAGVIGADDSLKAILNKILTEGITSEALMTQMIQGTPWYKNQTDAQRSYAYAKETNPGQFAADLQLNASNIVKQFMGNGISITAAQAIDYAQQLMQSVVIKDGKVVRYDQEYLNKIMANAIDFSKKSTIGGMTVFNMTGKLETVANELYKRAWDYGFPASTSNARFEEWFKNSMKGLIAGTLNVEDLDNELQSRAKSMFPGLTQQITQGQTLRQAADPWLNAIADTWEMDVNSLDLNNDYVQRALNYTDEKGNVSTMNLYDAKKMARRSSNWDYTSTAKEEKTKIASTILRDFGFLG